MQEVSRTSVYFMDKDYEVVIYKVNHTPIGALYPVKVDGNPYTLKRVHDTWECSRLNDALLEMVGKEIDKLSMF